MTKPPSYLPLKDGIRIAYHKTLPQDNRKPTIVFIHGYRSNMDGEKAIVLEQYCVRKGLGYLRFDCTGHGQSDGEFISGSISRWLSDALAAIDGLTEGKLILSGSSMGAWLSMLATLQRHDRVIGLLGIASAPDFTEELMWNGMTAAQKKAIVEDGVYYQASEYSFKPDGTPEFYPITKLLIEDGRKNLLLRNKIKIKCPVRLFHGMKDDDIPYEITDRIKNNLISDNVEIILSQQGDHRMSAPGDLAKLEKIIDELVLCTKVN